jgi:hypothetical protein
MRGLQTMKMLQRLQITLALCPILKTPPGPTMKTPLIQLMMKVVPIQMMLSTPMSWKLWLKTSTLLQSTLTSGILPLQIILHQRDLGLMTQGLRHHSTLNLQIWLAPHLLSSSTFHMASLVHQFPGNQKDQTCIMAVKRLSSHLPGHRFTHSVTGR